MAQDLGTLRVHLVASTRQFRNDMSSARQSLRRFDKDVFTVRNALRAFAGAAVVGYAAKKVFDLGAAVEETASKYRTVFGPAIDETNAFIEENARLMGLTDQQAKELLATTGAVTQGFGATKRESSSLSKEITLLAADIASFNNAQGGAEQVTRDIIGALGSEREALKKYGIVITETMVQQRAMAQTGKDNAKALTQLEKAYATVTLVSEKAGVAVGDLRRTSDQSANTYRRVAATVRQFRDDIAAGLLPALGVFLGEVDNGIGGLERLGKQFRNNSHAVVAWAKVAVAAIKAAFQPFASAIRLAFNLGQAITNAFQILWAEIKGDHQSADAALDLLRFNLSQAKDSVVDVGGAFTQLESAAAAAWAAMGRARAGAEAPVNVGGIAGGGGGGEGGPFAGIADPVVRLVDSMNRASVASQPMIANIRTMGEESRRLARAGEDIAMAFADAMVNSVRSAGDAFRSFVDYAISQLLRLAAQFAVFKGLQALFPGAGFVASLGQSLGFLGAPGRAHGGSVSSGRPYVVGERGPELFVPRQSGNVVPNNSITLNVSGMPPATNPLAMARDKDWLAFLNQSQQELAASGA